MKIQARILTSAEIGKILPFQQEWIMVDQITQIEIDEERNEVTGIKGIKNISSDAWWARMHFPGNPVFPGVLMLEGLNQIAGVILYLIYGNQDQSQQVFFSGFGSSLIKKPAFPGDIVEYYVKIKKRRLRVIKFHGIVKINGDTSIDTTINLSIFP